jgi:diaminopimelate epimerase
MQIMHAGQIRLRVFERGVGETLACGTGACAAVAVGRSLGLLGADVEVRVPGGALSVHWDGPGHSVWLTGPAQQSFEGRVEI